MGGGIRNKVKRTNFAKHVTVETVLKTINSNLDIPAVGDEIYKQYHDPSFLPETSTPSYKPQDPSSFPETSTASCKPQDPSSLPETSTSGSIPCFPRLGVIPKEKFQPLKSVVESDVTKPQSQGRMDPALLDDIITRLIGVSGYKQVLTESEIKQLCVASREIFLEQPNLLELEAPIKICGNIHGQYGDLLRLFEFGGFPPSANYLFLGGYVDHGKQSLETICLLIAFKIKYPENFFLLRGNHECASVSRIYGFYDECKRRFNVRLWKAFIDCFNCLPVAALIDDKILCMHGGLSPDLDDFDQIRNILRPTDIPDTGLLCDLLWSDPDPGVEGWGMNNDTNISFTFGSDKVSEFLTKHNLDLICRGHQVVEDGYEFFSNRQLVTIFSAPCYSDEYDNAGAMMSIDETLMCSFQILKPAERAQFTAR
ncbi:hypothetical protein FNV43_RR24730 [Rhamnella rubrinervis]|uniref:Serine/threonine-protein phosphatase n=1 Tax=Rhamnella rubrinervis TaxID=2594499 RepID=A0A8K0DYN3_9ROSA|nr:hypothetical protein FNV43_RR24730 [Rhamnella rubrinervis]